MTHASGAAQAVPSALDPAQIPCWLAPLTRGRPGVFLDYDGTLTPIVDRPDQATLAAGTRERLARLADRCPVTIVTGRDITVMQQFVQLDQVGYAGCHGLDITGPAGSGLRHTPRPRRCCRRWTRRRRICARPSPASRAY